MQSWACLDTDTSTIFVFSGVESKEAAKSDGIPNSFVIFCLFAYLNYTAGHSYFQPICRQAGSVQFCMWTKPCTLAPLLQQSVMLHPTHTPVVSQKLPHNELYLLDKTLGSQTP